MVSQQELNITSNFLAPHPPKYGLSHPYYNSFLVSLVKWFHLMASSLWKGICIKTANFQYFLKQKPSIIPQMETHHVCPNCLWPIGLLQFSTYTENNRLDQYYWFTQSNLTFICLKVPIHQTSRITCMYDAPKDLVCWKKVSLGVAFIWSDNLRSIY